ncbi:MAG: type II secretion system F family protein [Candidatus Wildermuthbacteria bacterium]|nr:type II secretion system F family protein [Candidatus Wildermuthbacteria bacterium]
MPLYSYNAISAQGERVSGEETANTEQELAHVLRARNLMLTSAKAKDNEKKSSPLSFLKISFGVSMGEKLFFIRNLKVMVSSGVSLPKSLDVLQEQAASSTFQKALRSIKEKILKGSTLSDAMGAYPAIFPDIFTNMIKVGEESGTLESVLSNLSLQLEKQHELRSKVLGALMYPAIVVCAMFGIGLMMLVVVVPTLAKTFADLGVQLPITTRLVIGLGNFLSFQWYFAIAIAASVSLLFWKAARTASGKRMLDSLTLKAPVISGIVKKTNAAVTVRTLSSLIASGVPIVRSLEITSKVLGNSFYREALANAAQEVGKGQKLSEVLKPASSLYPLIVIQMIEVGEETGQSSEVLGKLAEFFENEVEQITQNLASIVEPILMLLIGGVVGFFAVSMIQPMYSMLGSLQQQ